MTEPVNFQEFEFENHNLTLEQYKDLLYEEIMLYHYPEFRKSYFDRLDKGQSIMAHVIDNPNSKIVSFSKKA